MWDPTRSYTRVFIKNLVTEARVGMCPWEQHPEHPNKLIVNVELFASVTTDTLDDTRMNMIDYFPIRDALKEWPKRPHTALLETLLNEIIELSFQNPRVEACRVSIEKPNIFNEGGGGVELYKIRGQ